MNFKQLAFADFSQDVIKDFNIVAFDYRLALLGSTTDILALELRSTQFNFDSFPYRIDRVNIPSQRPCSKIIKDLDLCHIYAYSTVLDSQELALDSVYVSDYSPEAPKPQMQQVAWAPTNALQPNEEPLVALLSSYGACQLCVKDKISRKWNNIVCDINNLYMQQVFPIKSISSQEVRNFQAFKSVVDLQWITAVAWHPNKPIFYTANAVGWIVAFQLNGTYDLGVFFQYDCQMGRICYMHAFDDFLLLSNIMGVVKLFSQKPAASLDSDTGVLVVSPLIELECLWSKPDRISCRKAEVTHCKDLNYYNVVFCKSAHVLAYRLSAEGTVLCSCTLYVGGVKITGIETLSNNEYILTTIMGTVKHIRLDSNNINDLHINEQIVKTDFDTNNYQLLGVATTPQKQLWTFIQYRAKEYVHHSKYSSNSALVSVCKLSTIDSFQQLTNLNIKTLDPLVDYIVAVRLEMFNNLRHEEFNNYFELKNARFPTELNDAFMQKLQLKLMMVKAKAALQGETFKNIKAFTQNELDFLNCCVQTTHIIGSLKQLHAKIGSSKAPTRFQLMAGSCFRRKFHKLIRDLQVQVSDQNLLKDTIERYLRLATEAFKKIPNSYECEEQCLLCQALVDDVSMLCPQAHKVRRCCITYVQLPFFNSRYCAQCNETALDNDAQLREIIEPDEVFKCPFCRFVFVNESI